jgi:hypothetical protein
MNKKKHGIKSPRGIRAKRSARALKIFEALRSNAPPGTVLVLANARPAEATGQAANFLDVYHVSKPRSIVRGHPASPPDERSKKDTDKAAVRKAFRRSAKWMRYLTIFSSEGQVQASVDLDAGSRVDLSVDPQQQIAKTATGDADEGSSSSGIIGWIKANWKLTSIGAAVVLILVVGAWLSMRK